MKRLACLLALACGGSPPPPAPPLSNTAPADAREEAPDDALTELESVTRTRPAQIARLAQFRDLMCACRTPACGERVTDALERWGHAMADEDDIPTTIPPPTLEEAQQMHDLGRAIQACATAVTAGPRP